MILERLRPLTAGLVLAIAFGGGASAQDASAPKEATPNAGPDYALLTAMGTCADMKCLNAYRDQVGDRKLAKIVFYEKWFLLEPSKAPAEGLLRNLPASQAEQLQMMSLPDWHEGATKSEKDQKALAEIYRSWPASVAEAAMVFPQFLSVYIRYGLLAPNDVHSDFTGNEERVCRKDPREFQDAFERLDHKTQMQLRKTVFDPDKCRAIFVSESE